MGIPCVSFKNNEFLYSKPMVFCLDALYNCGPPGPKCVQAQKRALNFWQKRLLLSAGGSDLKFTHCREKSYVVESSCERDQIIM